MSTGRLVKLKTDMIFADFHNPFRTRTACMTSMAASHPIVSMTHYVTRPDLMEGMLSQSQAAATGTYFEAWRFYFKGNRLIPGEKKAWLSNPY